MADLEKTVSIVFKGVDDLSKTISGISGNLSGFEKSVSAVTQPMADIAEKVLKTEAALAALAAGGLAVAVKEAGSFTDAFNEISTLVDTNDAGFDRFKSSILDYATTSTASIEQVNGAIYAAISAGVDWKDSIDFVTAAEKLSVAGKADLQSTTVALISTLNAYGASTDQAGKYSDILFKTVKLGQTTLPELSQSLSQVTGIAASGNIPFETLGAAIAALTASGAPTSQAIIKIKAALSNIIKPSGEASEAAAALGIQFDASALKSKGFEGVLKDVYTATGGNVDQMAKLFGSTEGLSAALVLGADLGGKFSAALDEMKSAAGATDEAFAKMEANLGLITQNMINNLRAVLVDAGMPLLKDFGAIAGGITDVFKGIRISIGEGSFDPVYESIGRFSARLAEDLKKIAEILPEAIKHIDFSGLIESVEGLGSEIAEAFKALFEDVDLTTVEGLSQAIQKVVDAISAITNVTSGIVQAWKPFLAALSEGIDKFSSMDASTEKVVGNVLGFGQAINTIIGSVGAITGGLDLMSKSLAAMAGIQFVGLIGGLSTVGAILAPFAVGGAIGLGLANIISTIGDKLLPGVADIPREVPLTLTLDTGNVLEVATGIVRDIEGNIVSVPMDVEAVGRVADNTPEKIKEMLLNGATDAQLDYVINPSLENLKAALKESGALVEQEVKEWLQPIEKMTADLKPLELIDVESSEKNIDEIKIKADEMKTALEWTAKVNIAQAESAAKVLTSSFESGAEMVDSLSKSVTGLFGSFKSDMRMDDRWLLEDAIRQQMDLEQKSVDSQLKKDESMTKWLDAKTEALNRGESLIKIEAPGLQPQLEAFMWEILEAIQIRASEEGAEFLLGI